VSEERDQTQDSDNLELYFLGLMCYSLGQSMQPKEQDPEHHDSKNENKAHYDHEHIYFTGSRDE